MEKLISAFPANISEALEIAKRSKFKTPDREIQNIVICGMGGSGIGGKLVGKWIENEIGVPILFAHDYTLPSFVSKNTLVIGSSYSGNTEETLSTVEEAIEKGAFIVGITSGGEMQAICEKNGFDCVIVPGGNPPRTALAFSLVQLLNIFSELGMISSERLNEMETARQLIVQNEVNIKAKAHEIAAFLIGNVGVLYGTTIYEPVLVRARQQFNENGKLLCWHHSLPEMNHNELVGWGGGDDRFASIFFESDDIHPRNARRMEITKARIAAMSSKNMTISPKGNNLIERSIYYINLVDWASLYLAELKKVDPVDIEIIDYLKAELAKF